MIWSEIKQLWEVGLREYVSDMWNVVDFVTNSLYVATIALRIVAYYKVKTYCTFLKKIRLFPAFFGYFPSFRTNISKLFTTNYCEK